MFEIALYDHRAAMKKLERQMMAVMSCGLFKRFKFTEDAKRQLTNWIITGKCEPDKDE